jgi:hypothetical protein
LRLALSFFQPRATQVAAGVAVGVGVPVRVGVPVLVGVIVIVGVMVGVGVMVRVRVLVGVLVTVRVSVIVGVLVGVGVSVSVSVGVMVPFKHGARRNKSSGMEQLAGLASRWKVTMPASAKLMLPVKLQSASPLPAGVHVMAAGASQLPPRLSHKLIVTASPT